jgi:3-methyladenine DNA glycosylase AlkC
MSELEIKQIETLTKKFMSEYGYLRLTTQEAVITEDQWRTAEKNSQVKKVAAWQSLRIESPTEFELRTRRSDFLSKLEVQLREVASSGHIF